VRKVGTALAHCMLAEVLLRHRPAAMPDWKPWFLSPYG